MKKGTQTIGSYASNEDNSVLPIKTDNSTAQGIINNTIKQKRSKAMDMRFYWLRDRTKQGHFHIYWEPGQHNLADLPTKHHPGSHHKRLRPIYVYEQSRSPVSIQGCIKLLTKPCKTGADNPIKRHPSDTYIAHLCQLSHQLRHSLNQLKRDQIYKPPRS